VTVTYSSVPIIIRFVFNTFHSCFVIKIINIVLLLNIFLKIKKNASIFSSKDIASDIM